MASGETALPPKTGKESLSGGKAKDGASSEGTKDQAYNFRFVEVGEPSHGGNFSRSTIRSHVMRDYYEKKDNRRRPSTIPGVSSVASKKEGALQQTHRFKVGPDGLREVKARRKKVKGTSRSIKRASNVATEAPESGNLQVRAQSSLREHTTKLPESANFASANHWEKQRLVVSFDYDQWSAAESDIAIGDAQLSAQTDADSRNMAHPENISSISGAINPFNTLPVLCIPSSEHFLHHAAQAILSSRVMGPLRIEWLKLATRDRAFFHIALSHYAGNYGLSRAERDPMEAVRFRMEAMKIINERLGWDRVRTALTDGTLGTVASLASYEATNGEIVNIRTHMKGLQRMVILRSGLEEPSMNPYAKRLVLWADLNCAIAMGTNPVFSGLEPDPEYDQAGQLSTTDDAISQKPLVPMDRNTKVETLNIVLKESFENLKLLTQINGSKREPISIDKEESRRDSDSLYQTEKSLLTLSNIWGPRKFVTSGALAAIIYSDNQIRGINFRARIMDRVIERLQHALGMVIDDISQHDLEENAARAILWVLVVGGVAADHRPCRGWFLERILVFCDVLDTRTWDDTEEILQRFLWPAAWHKPACLLWEDVEEYRLMKYMSFPDATIADQGNVDEQRDGF